MLERWSASLITGAFDDVAQTDMGLGDMDDGVLIAFRNGIGSCHALRLKTIAKGHGAKHLAAKSVILAPPDRARIE